MLDVQHKFKTILDSVFDTARNVVKMLSGVKFRIKIYRFRIDQIKVGYNDTAGTVICHSQVRVVKLLSRVAVL